MPGLFFLLLLLLFVPPPPLMVLPPDILRFRRLFGACLDGSAEGADRQTERRHLAALLGAVGGGFIYVCVRVCVPTWWRHHPLPFLKEAGLEAVSGAEAVGLVSGHQLLHGLQNHTQLEDTQQRGAEGRSVRSNKTQTALTGHRFAAYDRQVRL